MMKENQKKEKTFFKKHNYLQKKKKQLRITEYE